MKLLQTQEYLLLIDEEAEIKRGDYILEKESIINVFPDYLTDLDECAKIIAYYPLNSEAKELDLPLLPPFEEDKYIKDLAQQRWGNVHRTGVLGFIEGYKAAQSKQFSLEDMEKAFRAGSEFGSAPFSSQGKELIDENKFIQSLSTQQLPNEFITEYVEVVNSKWGHGAPVDFIPKTITNSEGKEEIQGTYKY